MTQNNIDTGKLWKTGKVYKNQLFLLNFPFCNGNSFLKFNLRLEGIKLIFVI